MPSLTAPGRQVFSARESLAMVPAKSSNDATGWRSPTGTALTRATQRYGQRIRRKHYFAAFALIEWQVSNHFGHSQRREARRSSARLDAADGLPGAWVDTKVLPPIIDRRRRHSRRSDAKPEVAELQRAQGRLDIRHRRIGTAGGPSGSRRTNDKKPAVDRPAFRGSTTGDYFSNDSTEFGIWLACDSIAVAACDNTWVFDNVAVSLA